MMHEYYANLQSSYVAIYFVFNPWTYTFKESDGEVFITVEKVDGQLTEVVYEVDLKIFFLSATTQDFAVLPLNSTRDCCSDVASQPFNQQAIYTCFEPDEAFIHIPIQIFQDEVVEPYEYIYIVLSLYETCVYQSYQELCIIEIIDDDGKCSCIRFH